MLISILPQSSHHETAVFEDHNSFQPITLYIPLSKCYCSQVIRNFNQCFQLVTIGDICHIAIFISQSNDPNPGKGQNLYTKPYRQCVSKKHLKYIESSKIFEKVMRGKEQSAIPPLCIVEFHCLQDSSKCYAVRKVMYVKNKP